MRDFGIIHTRYWSWARRKGLKDAPKLLGAYLLSSPHGNSIGCFYCPMVYVAHDLGHSVNTVSTGCRELEKNDFLLFCEATEHVFLIKYLKWNPIKNPSHAKNILAAVLDLPSEFSYFDKLFESLEKYSGKHLKKDHVDTVRDTVSTRCPSLCPPPCDTPSPPQCGHKDRDRDTDTDTNTFSSDSDEIRLSKLLFSLILKNDPKAKEPNFQKWAVHVEQLIRLDKRSVDEIERIIRWCQADNFWKGNILSTGSLRKKFSQLVIKSKGKKRKRGIDDFQGSKYKGTPEGELPDWARSAANV